MYSKMGRPPIDNPKSVKYSIRLDEKTEKRLLVYCKRHKLKRGEVIRRAIKALLGMEEI